MNYCVILVYCVLDRKTKSMLFSSYCLDAYGSQMWPFYDKSINNYFTAWRKTIRKIWRLPNLTHCRFLHTVNDSLSIDIMLEKRCLKFVWSCLNSSNCIVKGIANNSIVQSSSVFGENYRFLSNKYNIWPSYWKKPFNCILKCVDNYVCVHLVHFNEAIMIRDLCLNIDSGNFTVSTCEEMCHLIEYLCTI